MRDADIQYFVIKVTFKDDSNKKVALLAKSRAEGLAKVRVQFRDIKTVEIINNKDNPIPDRVIL